MSQVFKHGWKSLGLLAMITALIAVACGPAATPTPAPTSAPTRAPVATATRALATPPQSAATPTRAAATPTQAPPTPAPQATPTAKAVFGQFKIDPTKIGGIKYPYGKPDFSLTPKTGGLLKTANRDAWPHFDVTGVTGAGILGPLQPAYSKLVVCKGPLEMTNPNAWLCEAGPQLAESWQMSDGGKVWTFNLRKGVKWQNLPPVNGREFVSDDVKYTYELFMKSPTRAAPYALVDKIETPDKYTVKVTLKAPYADFVLTAMAERYAFILPHEIADRDGDFKKTLVGTGPFQLKQITGKEQLVYERNPNYFIPGAPLLGGLEYTIINDLSAQRAAFRAGIEHMVTGDNLTVREMAPLLASAPHTVPYVFESDYAQFALYVRMDKAPFSDVRVRRAISMAIDRPGINKDIFEGEASIMTPIPWEYMYDTKPTLDKLPYYKFDRDAAKKLLADAGYASGFKFSANYYPYGEVAKQIAVWVDNLKAVGITMDLAQQDNTTFNAALRAGSYEWAATGSVVIWSGLDGWLYGNMYSAEVNNYGKIKNADLDKLLNAQRVEIDPAKRKEIARKVYEMEADLVWRIPFARSNPITYYSNKLHNSVYHQSMIPSYNSANTLDYMWVE